MKILILSTKVPFPPKDGGAIATLSLAEGLSDVGDVVYMLCLNTSKHPFNIQNISVAIKKKIKFFAVNHDTRIRILKMISNFFLSRQPYNATRFMSLKFERNLISILKEVNPDIVQMEGPYLNYCIPSIRKYSKAKISLRAHNVENEIWKRKALKSFNPVKKVYLNVLSRRIKWLEINTLIKSDFLVAISDRDRKILLNNKEIKNITIPTGLNPYRYPSPKDPEFPSMFFIGALDWMPNQEGIIWFIEKVHLKLFEKKPDVKLHIAGRNAPAWLEDKIKSFSDQSVVYHGEVENAYQFMNKYAIFVSPLFTGSGIRIKILEGMMMQRVIVATTIAAEGIPVSHQQNIFIIDDPQEMLDCLLDLCRNREDYNTIGRESRAFVIENFNNLATSKRLSEFYRMNLS